MIPVVTKMILIIVIFDGIKPLTSALEAPHIDVSNYKMCQVTYERTPRTPPDDHVYVFYCLRANVSFKKC